MAAVALALAASLAWGVADFSGGVLARRLPLAAVVVGSQAAGFGLLLVLVVSAGGVDWRAAAIGAVGGVGGGAGLACFYAALARGTMSIVSPIAACSALVPLALALGTGERPSALALAGSATALGGAVLASLEERGNARDGAGRAVLLAAAAAIGFGLFVFFLGRAARHGATISALAGARVGSLALLLTWVALSRASLRTGRGAAPWVVLVGLGDVTANALFALASQRGLLAVVSVLGSLYPVVTVLLAHLLLHERISAVQRLGIAVALTGVAIVGTA